MRLAVAILLVMTASCIDEVVVSKAGNLTCTYGETTIFSGTFRLDGLGLEPVAERLSGEWSFCGSHAPVRCRLVVTP